MSFRSMAFSANILIYVFSSSHATFSSFVDMDFFKLSLSVFNAISDKARTEALRTEASLSFSLSRRRATSFSLAILPRAYTALALTRPSL